MEKEILLRAVLLWMLFIPVPIINGIMREKWYKRTYGELRAHQIGSVIVAVMFVLFVYVFFGHVILSLSVDHLMQIGFLWCAMTVIFECALGLRRGLSWSQIFADYNVFRGRLWIVVLMTILCAPLLVRMIM